MDGSDMAFDYKAVAAGIARSEGMGALLPVVEKELLHYRILSAMQDGGFFGPIVFQGGTTPASVPRVPPVTARTSTSPAARVSASMTFGGWANASGPPSPACPRTCR